MAIDLNELGITQEELQKRVVERLCQLTLNEHGLDEDGDESILPTSFSRKLQELVKSRIDKTIQDLAEKHILPNVSQYVENATLQETNKWGEKTGQKLTFIEYLVQRAEAYIQEPVNYDGKSKSESDSYGWAKVQTRITHLVHKHLHYSIEAAMKKAVEAANSAIATGIQETVKIKLEEVVKGLKVNIATK